MGFGEVLIQGEQILELFGLEGRADGGLEGRQPRAGMTVQDGLAVELVLEFEGEFAVKGQTERGGEVVGLRRRLELAVDGRHPDFDPVELGVECPSGGLVDPRAAFDLVGETGDELEPRRIAAEGGIDRRQSVEVGGWAGRKDTQVLLAQFQGDGCPKILFRDARALGRRFEGLAVDLAGLPQGRVVTRFVKSAGFGQPRRPIDEGRARRDTRPSSPTRRRRRATGCRKRWPPFLFGSRSRLPRPPVFPRLQITPRPAGSFSPGPHVKFTGRIVNLLTFPEKDRPRRSGPWLQSAWKRAKLRLKALACSVQ